MTHSTGNSRVVVGTASEWHRQCSFRGSVRVGHY